MRKPSNFLFPHTVDHHAVTGHTKDTSGAKVPIHALATSGVKAFVQPAGSDVVAEYAQINETVSHTIFLQSLTVFDAIGISHRIVYDSNNYRVKGKKNPCELNRVGRLDIEIEPT